MRLYKYISCRKSGNIDLVALENILKGKLKFAASRDLNDPAEINHEYNKQAINQSLQELIDLGYSDEGFEFLKKQCAILEKIGIIPPTFFSCFSCAQEATDFIRTVHNTAHRLIMMDGFRYITNELANKVGVFCVADDYASSTMWAHYADNSHGVAIEFARLHDAFQVDETGLFSQLRQITYKTPRALMTFDPRSHENLFFVNIAATRLRCAAGWHPVRRPLHQRQAHPQVNGRRLRQLHRQADRDPARYR